MWATSFFFHSHVRWSEDEMKGKADNRNGTERNAHKSKGTTTYAQARRVVHRQTKRNPLLHVFLCVVVFVVAAELCDTCQRKIVCGKMYGTLHS